MDGEKMNFITRPVVELTFCFVNILAEIYDFAYNRLKSFFI